MKTNDFESEAKNAIIRLFENIPFIKIEKIQAKPLIENKRPDLFIQVQSNNEEISFIIEIKKNGEPRYAREAINQLLLYLKEIPNSFGIFCSTYISPRSAKLCEDAGVGYVDLAGNSYISIKNIYIKNSGNENPYPREKYLRSLFSPKAERVLRVLISSGKREWKTEELAGEANVSIGQVYNVKQLLLDQEWAKSKQIGFSLSEPNSLIDEWSKKYKYERNQLFYYYSIITIAEIEEMIGNYCRKNDTQYALTEFSASTRFAPTVRYQRVTAYVSGNIIPIAEDMGLKQVSSGSNIALIQPYDEGVFWGSRQIEKINVVTPIQAYLDLQSRKGRGEEAAQALLEKEILPKW